MIDAQMNSLVHKKDEGHRTHIRQPRAVLNSISKEIHASGFLGPLQLQKHTPHRHAQVYFFK